MTDIPRRIDHQRWTPAEQAIQGAVDAVEAMPADVRLTQAVILLGDARRNVADFVDGVVSAATQSPLVSVGDNAEVVKRLRSELDEFDRSVRTSSSGVNDVTLSRVVILSAINALQKGAK